MHLAVDGTYQSVINNPGGGATFLIELIPRLSRDLTRSGDRLTVFCPRADRRYYQRLGIKTIAFPTTPSPLRGLSTHVLVPLYAKAIGVDILLQPGNFASLLKTTKQIVIAQSVLTFKHFPEELGALKAIYRRMMLWMTTTRADALVFLSHAQQQEFYHYYRRLPPHVVIYPGAPEVARRVPNRKRWILAVNSLWKYKNLEGVVEIASRLREKGMPLPVYIVGDGPSHGALNQDIRTRGLHETVVLLGARSLHEVYTLYEDALLTINLSAVESFGFPILESMAYGVPVIISDQASLQEVAGLAGVVVSNTDVAAHWIEMWAQSEQDWQAASALGLTRAGRFSWDTTASEMIQLCLAVARGENPPVIREEYFPEEERRGRISPAAEKVLR